MDLVEVSPDASDGLGTLLEVNESIPDELIRQIVGVGQSQIGLIEVFHAALTEPYIEICLAVICSYFSSSNISLSIT